MSKIHAHITTISHRSSTVCGRRRHSAPSATTLNTQTLETTPTMAGV